MNYLTIHTSLNYLVFLQNNYFDLNGKCYNQVLDTAMRNKLASSYANLFSPKLKIKMYTHIPYNHIFKMFTDNIFIVWPMAWMHGSNL